jgi:non-specific serine/threonine protein kinase
LIGRTLAHYKIDSSLGAGGMGEVYRARDTRLGRDVAIKVLPQDVASDPERLARFQREARAIAALNHPNVVTVYSVEEAENIHFITMELIEGQALDRMISTQGLPSERIIEIASAVAEALTAAHEKGIVHRDLKPGNVMVTKDGRVKVLDFGLAKDIGAESGDSATLTSAGHTQAGVVMGTPAYMSPEQVSGRVLDHRSDIFSLGVVLHEMATGHRPFEGGSSAELISSILRDTPPSVTDARPDLPSDLARVIRRCLEKDPRYRMQTARDVSNEFRDLIRTSTRANPVPTSSARSAATSSGETRSDEGFWVAVLPFKYSGNNADLKALAEGLSEEVITGLSRFSYLRVIARGSTAKYSSDSGDVRAIGKELGARYVMEGSLRQAGNKLRLAIQLADTVSGAHLWAETYERTFTPESVFEVQDDLVPRIVATVADQYGILPRSMSETLRSKPEDTLTPHEAVLRAFSYFRRITPEEHAVVRDILERAVKEAPDHADSWAMLSMMYRGEFAQGFNPRPDSLDRALAAARRALELAPSHALGHYALATVYFFRKDRMHFRVEAERVLSLNPNDAAAKAYLGFLLAAQGEWERGCQMVESAMQLNPNCPGYFYFARSLNSYRLGKYEETLEGVARINMPGYFHVPAILAAALGQLGRHDEAAKALQDLLALRPYFAAEAREEYAKLYDEEHAEHIIDGLRKAGLEIVEDTSGVSSGKPTAASGATRTSVVPGTGSGARVAVREDEGFWVAVLPFKHAGNGVDLTALADGLTDDIVTNMSKFSYLRVIARSSTARYVHEAVDVRVAARELGARYIMEGSIRQAGTKIRIAAQLSDAATGASLWCETYDRISSPESAFDLLDDVVPRIVATVGDSQGILAHSMTEALRNRDPQSFTPYEAVLRSFGFHQYVNAPEHLAGRTALERAVKQSPDNADCWAMLSWLYRAEYSHAYNARPDAMDRSLSAARRAVELAPSAAFAHAAMAAAFFFRREFPAFRAAGDRAIALNRTEGYTTAFLGMLYAFSGDWERGRALMDRATQLNPHHPGWYWFPEIIDAYRRGDGERALQALLKVNMPQLWTVQMASVVVYSQLGKLDIARAELRELIASRPDFATAPLEYLEKWWQPEMIEQMLGDLRKAGLKA